MWEIAMQLKLSRLLFFWALAALCWFIPQSLVNSAEPQEEEARIPISGTKSKKLTALDTVMLTYMKSTGSSAATLAITRKGALIYSRGYGWADKEKKVPCAPNTLIGIASCDKPITAALIRLLARLGLLNLNESFFAALKVTPKGPIIDERVKKIRITHLLEHKAGWGSSPERKAFEAAKKAGLTEPYETKDLLGYVMAGQLDDPPGAKFAYCNSGYEWLRFLAEQRIRKPFDDGFRNMLFKPARMHEIVATKHLAELEKTAKQKNRLSICWNAREGGPVCASAPLLCQFMRRYWINGEPRDTGNPRWVMNGSLPGSTALMIWRSDGINVAALFNSRDKATHKEIEEALERALRTMGIANN
jgi:CubicO group peptidase (beta-lactamase class C family)